MWNNTKLAKNKKEDYYEDIYKYLISKDKAVYKGTNKIDWEKVIYPSYIWYTFKQKEKSEKKWKI